MTTVATSNGASKECDGVSKQDAAATGLPDIYNAACEMLAQHFAGTHNIHLERHHFRERCQLHGEPNADFALMLRELAASGNFVELANDNICNQFTTGIASP
ncbi:hypothetical protein HPB50_005937 [Hyalomma asiaticum]|uniref:Uncharacterized protein n=1 Tax=Hyalomma asiaticum TaxID=266040 RepID=A0ACB7THN9_HYAAI|nr:hypothetical protein HPB50_005937 [Hyalomma asiaticum]